MTSGSFEDRYAGFIILAGMIMIFVVIGIWIYLGLVIIPVHSSDCYAMNIGNGTMWNSGMVLSLQEQCIRCYEIEMNDEWYYDNGYADLVKECRK